MFQFRSHSRTALFWLFATSMFNTAQAFVNSIHHANKQDHTSVIAHEIPPRRPARRISKTSIYFKPPWLKRKGGDDSSDKERPKKSKADLDMEELQRAARDPKAFEAYVMRKNSAIDKLDNEPEKVPDPGQDSSTSEESSPKRPKYVPIEQWDAERKKDDMSWEERVQFDGQRYGNRYKQNEILQSNINRF